MTTFTESGHSSSRPWSFSQADFDRFARLSGDDNPIHVDADYAAQTQFGQTVAHGMLLFGVVSSALWQHPEAEHGLVVGQEMMFGAPTYAGEPLLIITRQGEADQKTGLTVFETAIAKPDGTLGLNGRAKLYQGDLRELPQTIVGSSLNSEIHDADRFKGMFVGQSAKETDVFSADRVADYIDLTGEKNPLFQDPLAARQLGLDGIMVPLPLLCGLFSKLLGTKLPGRGTNWLKLKVALSKPALVGDEITAEVAVSRLRPEKELVNLRTTCWNQRGQAICVGEALVLARDVDRR